MNKIKHISREQRRQDRVRGKIHGTAERPRLSVFRSNKHVFAQVINDDKGITLAASHENNVVTDKKKAGTKSEKAAQIGQHIAEQLKKHNIKRLAFDRGKYSYHGRIKVIAETVRQAGVEV